MQRRWKRCVVGMMLSMILLVVGPLAASSQPADIDVFGVIKVTDPEGLVAKIGMLVDNVEPGVGAMVNGMAMGQLQMILQNPQWVGVDKLGEFSVVITNPMMGSPAALLLPLTNEAKFVDTMKQAMTGGEEVDGVLQFGEEGMQHMFFAGAGSVGVLADNAAMVAQIKALVESGSPLLDADLTVKGQITASIAMSKIMTAFGPMIDQYSEMAVMGMSQGMAEDEADAGAAEPMANMVQAEINSLVGLLQQIETLELGITVNPDDDVRVMKAVKAMPDSEVAKFFAAQAPEKSDMLGFLPADAALVSSGSLELTPEFIDGYADFSKAIGAAASPEDAASADKMAQYTKDMMLAGSGSFAMSMFSPSQDSIVTAISLLADPAQYKSLLQQYPEVFQNFLGMYDDMGLEFDLQVSEAEQYKGGEILTMDLGFGAEDIPDPERQEMFKSLLGEQLNVPMGVVGNYAVIGVGKDARSHVEGLLDAVEAADRGAVALSPANFGLPEENNFFLGLSVPKILKWAAAYAPDAPEFDIIDGPGLGMSASFADSHAVGELVVPLAEILAIKDVMMKVQEPSEGSME